MMRRVRKEEVEPLCSVKPDGLSICLECWKLFMSADDRDLGASAMKLRAVVDDKESEKGVYESDPYGSQYKADLVIGQATDVCIDDLETHLRDAIFKKCGIMRVWRYGSLALMSVLVEAEEKLVEKLKQHFDTAHLF